jgi:hypothetical protein
MDWRFHLAVGLEILERSSLSVVLFPLCPVRHSRCSEPPFRCFDGGPAFRLAGTCPCPWFLDQLCNTV